MPCIVATIASGCLSLLMGPLSLICWPAFFILVKKGIADEIDETTKADTLRIIDEARRKGERSVTVKQIIPSNGAMFNIPLTRKHRVLFDEKD